MKGKTIALIVVLAVIIAAILYIESTKPDIPDVVLDEQVTVTDAQGIEYPVAPELIPTGGWINSEPFTLEELRGKVVLIDFWTYSCINCIRTLPFLTSWQEKYADAGLVIVGVHTPEFDFEKKLDNVQRAVDKHGVNYAVVQDNDYKTWRAYRNSYWPRKYLIDIDGLIRYDHIGEGAYAETEAVIQALLNERMEALGIEMAIGEDMVSPEDVIDVEFGRIRTPELYFGYDFRRTPFGNPEGYRPETTVTYAVPSSRLDNVAYVTGTWVIKPDYMELLSEGTVLLKYNAKDVNIVASGDPTGNVEVLLDGESIDPESAGSDVVDGVAEVGDERLYNVVSMDYAYHDLELKADKGFRIYTFTFG